MQKTSEYKRRDFVCRKQVNRKDDISYVENKCIEKMIFRMQKQVKIKDEISYVENN